MKLQIAKISNVPIVLTQNWFIIIAVLTLMTAFTSGLMTAFNTLLVVLFLTLFVVLHELGHVFMAKHYGAYTNAIQIDFFGGAAQVSENGWRKLLAKPLHAMAVWAAGPAVSVSLYALLFAITKIIPLNDYFSYGIHYLALVNLMLAIFNMMPVFPLDGGGILYCVLRLITSKALAIRITSIVGIVGGALFILIALKLHAVMLGVIGVIAILQSYAAPKSQFFRE